jgi:DNA-nicking Smr family endonuclease
MQKALEIDLHGLNMSESKVILDEFFEWLKKNGNDIDKLDIVVGVGKGSIMGPVLPSFVMNYLKERGMIGELKGGVVEVLFKK